MFFHVYYAEAEIKSFKNKIKVTSNNWTKISTSYHNYFIPPVSPYNHSEWIMLKHPILKTNHLKKEKKEKRDKRDRDLSFIEYANTATDLVTKALKKDEFEGHQLSEIMYTG